MTPYRWRIHAVAIAVGCLTGLGVGASCTMLQAKSAAEAALTVSQIACVLASEFTDSNTLAIACKIDAELLPSLRQMIAIREGAKKAGVRWSSPDGGAP